jgi:hypothetical protein
MVGFALLYPPYRSLAIEFIWMIYLTITKNIL